MILDQSEQTIDHRNYNLYSMGTSSRGRWRGKSSCNQPGLAITDERRNDALHVLSKVMKAICIGRDEKEVLHHWKTKRSI